MLAYSGVLLGLFGVMANDEPWRPHSLVAIAHTAGGDGDS